MILVTLGTQDKSFTRILKELDRLKDKGIIKDKIIVQAGYTKYKSNNLEIFDYINEKDFNKYYESASLIITHGGVGSIIKGLEHNKVVIAVPRLSKYDEHENDHQLQIIDEFYKTGYILKCIEMKDLEKTIKDSKTFKGKKFKSNNGNLVKLIDDYIEKDIKMKEEKKKKNSIPDKDRKLLIRKGNNIFVKFWNWGWNIYYDNPELWNYLIVGGLTTVVAIGSKLILLHTVFDQTNGLELQYAEICSWFIALIFAYIKGRLEGFIYESTIKQVIVDEAQDYNRLQYIIINQIFKKADFTILGDINQNINPYYQYKSLEDLKDLFKGETKYLELLKTYRSSPEIIEYTNKILNLNHVNAVRKNTNKPVIIRKGIEELKDKLLEDINNLQSNYKSTAIITKDNKEAEYIYDLLKDKIDISLVDATTKGFSKELIIIPAYVAKGLEFDSVIIYNDRNNSYKKNERNLLYVACTRCQHELYIYN